MATQKISVSLRRTNLKACEKQYIGAIDTRGTMNINDIAGQIVASRTELNQQTIISILNLAAQISIDSLAAGKTVNLGVGHLQPYVCGTFDSPRDAFNTERHSIKVAFKPDAALAKALLAADVDTHAAHDGVTINSITDYVTGSVNNLLTSGGLVTIRGRQVKIIGDDPSVGLTLTHTDGTVYQPLIIGTNTTSRLDFTLPELPDGQYTLSLTTQCGTQGRKLSTVSSDTFSLPLTVGKL